MASSSSSPSQSSFVAASTSQNVANEATPGPARRRRPVVARWSWWDKINCLIGGGSRAWTCKLYGYKRSGEANKVRAHFLQESGHEAPFCTKVTPEKKQELLDKLAVYEVTEAARRHPQVAVDPNFMVRGRGHGIETGGSSSRSEPLPPYASFPSRVASSTIPTRPRQSTLDENWNPRLKEEADMAVARFFFHDHITFRAAR